MKMSSTTNTKSFADLAPLMVQKERATGTFDVDILIEMIQGSKALQARKKELREMVQRHPVLKDRDMMFRNHTQRYEYALKKACYYVKFIKDHHIDDPDERTWVYSLLGEPLPIDVHRSMFIPTLENQMDDEQKAKWLPLATEYKITGAYAQTELAHGSNVQGIETTAHFDQSTQEFIIDSPTITSRKWWPGGLAKTANHAVVHARLFLGDEKKDVGVQAFLVQIRSLENHMPMKGIEIGDIGPKVGFNSIDNGYCSFDHVRIPRENMLMRFAKVTPNGKFIKPPMDKLVYLTMVRVRVVLLGFCGKLMGAAATIASRFSASRLQGSIASIDRKKKSDKWTECQVLDYQNQQLTIFPLIGLAYACHFCSNNILKIYDNVLDGIAQNSNFAEQLAQLHSSASGLKAFLTYTVSDGIERVRRACGGHGYSASSNLPHIFNEFVGACTYEGTYDVLVQQHGLFLLKSLAQRLYSEPQTREELGPILGFFSSFRSAIDCSIKCNVERAQDFMDMNIIRAAFETRVAKLLYKAANYVQKAKQDDPNATFNTSMMDLTRASSAHAELLLVDFFARGVADIKDVALKSAMQELFFVFSFWLMGNSMGEFRNDDYISSEQAEMIRSQMLKMLPVIRRNAITLTDGFGLSDFELNSAIGRYDGDMYRALISRAADEPLNRSERPKGYEEYLKPMFQSSNL